MYAYHHNAAHENPNRKNAGEARNRDAGHRESPQTSNKDRVGDWREGVDPDHPVIQAIELIATIDLINNLTLPVIVVQE